TDTGFTVSAASGPITPSNPSSSYPHDIPLTITGPTTGTAVTVTDANGRSQTITIVTVSSGDLRRHHPRFRPHPRN
ncbi:MAG TPA: hypothetical protein VMH02_11225, partial [Verrucomicrobiae bacterium]|nr:hypothetical protein [Verrucomicrobiae bacterium]